MSAWPHNDLPGAGLLAECDIEAACSAKKVIVLKREQVEGTDDMSDVACSTCRGRCGAPQACHQPEPVPAGYVFPLEPILTRHQWLGPTLLALICFVWLCIDGYMENLP